MGRIGELIWDKRMMSRLKRDFQALGKLPNGAASKAARVGAKIALTEAKARAPQDLGYLKRALGLKGEKARKRGKKVFQVALNPSFNDVFVKVSKAGKRSYYPASQERGWFAVNGRYIPGFHYLRKGIDQRKGEIKKAVLQKLADEFDKALR